MLFAAFGLHSRDRRRMAEGGGHGRDRNPGAGAQRARDGSWRAARDQRPYEAPADRTSLKADRSPARRTRTPTMSAESHSHRDSLIQPSVPGSAERVDAEPSQPESLRAQPKATAPSPVEVGVEELTTAQCWSWSDKPTSADSQWIHTTGDPTSSPSTSSSTTATSSSDPHRARNSAASRGEPGRRLRSRRLGPWIPLERRHPCECAATGHGCRHPGVRHPRSRFLEPDRSSTS